MKIHRRGGIRIGGIVLLFGLLILLAAASGCSINRMATRMVADSLASAGTGGSAFAGDEDPELVGEALPFALKLYEMLIQSDPKNDDLLLAAGSGYISYAYAYIEHPARMLPDGEYQKQKAMIERAEQMYLRGRNYVFDALELRYPGFYQAALDGALEKELNRTGEKDADALYWAASGWMAAISASNMDFTMVVDLPRAVAMMARLLELNPGYDDGALHELFIQLYGSVANYGMMYGSGELGDYTQKVLNSYYEGLDEVLETPEQRAEFHLGRAVSLSGGLRAAPYVSFASTFPVRDQEAGRYRALLQKALAIDVDRNPDDRLINILNQRKARWLLSTMDERFITLEAEE